MKYFTLNVNNTEYRLRLTIKGQKNLVNKLNKPPLEIIIDAVENHALLSDVFQEALNWNGNENCNSIKNGEQLYDLLVDENFITDMQSAAIIALGIALVSGLVSQAQYDDFLDELKKVSD